VLVEKEKKNIAFLAFEKRAVTQNQLDFMNLKKLKKVNLINYQTK
jgi:hypothetical protein